MRMALSPAERALVGLVSPRLSHSHFGSNESSHVPHKAIHGHCQQLGRSRQRPPSTTTEPRPRSSCSWLSASDSKLGRSSRTKRRNLRREGRQQLRGHCATMSRRRGRREVPERLAAPRLQHITEVAGSAAAEDALPAEPTQRHDEYVTCLARHTDRTQRNNGEPCAYATNVVARRAGHRYYQR